ncbi:SitI3 family protein [Glycomyces dulcitolivorans]|uniref:SitI3 family protein n=1 Tax=Glycomyces dulcitolivorans TaxID=2200759 RepID=UPI000DD386F9|nr:SitI3 family protein [Glycomyces dulcitolivorans]
MAIEYHFEASPVLDANGMLGYFADLLGCDERYEEPGAPARAFKKEVAVTAAVWDGEEEPDMAALFGVDRIASVTFRMNKFLTSEEDAATFRDMVASSAKFLEDHPGAKGVLSFQYEDIYLLRTENTIVLSDRLSGTDFNVDGVLDALLERYPKRNLGMVEDLLPR